MQNRACQRQEIVPILTDKRPEITIHTTHTEYFEEMMYNRVNLCPIPKIRNLNAVIRFEIVGNNPGIWTIFIEKGILKRIVREQLVKGLIEETIVREKCYHNTLPETASEVTGRKSTCTFELEGKTFMSVIRREITPQQALFQRKVRISGDMLLALKMNVLVNYL
ncbi:MAG: SCP2 sterol-binding domain-containing protein [Candidatus Scalindua sp.]|nr:SCP2 sterol-binding domain-containing protein [Candidatus Scalindua sp.]